MTPEFKRVLAIAHAHHLVNEIVHPGLHRQAVAYLGGDPTPLTFDMVKEKHGQHVAEAWVEFAQAHRHLLQAMGVEP